MDRNPYVPLVKLANHSYGSLKSTEQGFLFAWIGVLCIASVLGCFRLACGLCLGEPVCHYTPSKETLGCKTGALFCGATVSCNEPAKLEVDAYCNDLNP